MAWPPFSLFNRKNQQSRRTLGMFQKVMIKSSRLPIDFLTSLLTVFLSERRKKVDDFMLRM